MQSAQLTKSETINAINNVWGHGSNLTAGQFDILDKSLPPSDMPILDRLLENIDLLAEYNKASRPAFADFRRWWAWNFPTR
jgi:hypothetical protein